MTLLDMARLCVTSGTLIVAAMLLLGTMMIHHKPEAGLILAASPAVPVPVVKTESDTRVATADADRPTS